MTPAPPPARHRLDATSPRFAAALRAAAPDARRRAMLVACEAAAACNPDHHLDEAVLRLRRGDRESSYLRGRLADASAGLDVAASLLLERTDGDHRAKAQECWRAARAAAALAYALAGEGAPFDAIYEAAFASPEPDGVFAAAEAALAKADDT